MRKVIPLFITAALIFGGCGDQAKVQDLEQQNNTLKQQLASNDSTLHDVTLAMNEIHSRLVAALAMGKNAGGEAAPTESLNLGALRQMVLDQISAVTSRLAQGRRRIAQLEQKLRGAGSEYAGLQKQVADLKKSLDAQEKSVAELRSRIRSLEAEAAQKDQAVVGDKSTVESLTRQLNTVYYAVGDRTELEQKGVITDEGGFLWGLLGATTVLTTNFDDQAFQAVDKRTESSIDVPGKIDELVPKRDASSYSKEAQENGHTILRIVRPDYFWKVNHLAIITE
jgi:prefoldin subunit 5